MSTEFSSNEFFTDEALRTAAQAVRDSMLSALIEDSECHHTFSSQFLSRIQNLLQKEKRRLQWKSFLQHAAVLFLGILFTGALFLAFNPDARADFSRWIRNTYESSIFYQFFSGHSGVQATSLPDHDFTWLPGHYEVQEVYNDGQKRMTMLIGANDVIMLEYWPTDGSDYVEVFTSDFEQETAEINSERADFYRSISPDTANILVWTNNRNTIVYNLSASLPKEIMIKIAEGITEK